MEQLYWIKSQNIKLTVNKSVHFRSIFRQMSTIPSQLTSINERIQRRTMKSSSFSKLNKERSIRKIFPGHHINQKTPQSSTKRMFNEYEISLQVSKEMKLIHELLNQIRPQLQQIQRKNNDLTMMEILFDLEQKIKRKNYQLTQINNENKELKSTNKKGLRYNTNDSQQINAENSQETFKLAHQLKQQRQQLIKIKNIQLQKKNKLQLIKNQCLKLQTQYIDRCKKTKQKPLTYEMFKSLNQEKKKQLNNEIHFQERKGRRRQTLKEMLKSNSFHNTPTKNTQKNLKEIVSRKKIAQQALKTARKKYHQEISQFYAKLEFLREEDLALVQTLRQKQIEYYGLQNKFNESRKYGNNKIGQYHKMGDTLRFKGDYEDIEEMRKTKKKQKLFGPQNI